MARFLNRDIPWTAACRLVVLKTKCYRKVSPYGLWTAPGAGCSSGISLCTTTVDDIMWEGILTDLAKVRDTSREILDPFKKKQLVTLSLRWNTIR
jgi:hypothetical protein